MQRMVNIRLEKRNDMTTLMSVASIKGLMKTFSMFHGIYLQTLMTRAKKAIFPPAAALSALAPD